MFCVCFGHCDANVLLEEEPEQTVFAWNTLETVWVSGSRSYYKDDILLLKSANGEGERTQGHTVPSVSPAFRRSNHAVQTDEPPSYEDALQQPKYADFPAPPTMASPSHRLRPTAPALTPLPRRLRHQQDVLWLLPKCSAHHRPPLSAGVPSSNTGDMEDFLSTQLESTSIRHAFIRKVYLTLAAQLAVTFSVVAVFIFVEPVQKFVQIYSGVYWASFGIFVVVYCILICCKEPRRRFPWNLLLLGVFTLALSYMAGTISSYYETKAVFVAMGVTAVICVAVTLFCFQTKVDFTSCGGLLCIVSVLLVVLGIVTAVVLSFKYVPWLHMLYAAIGAIVHTLFLVYNTQLLMGNRQLALSPEEYIYGALSLYIDVVDIFLFILQISGAADLD
ncbi:protein lifeguard 3-like [Sphaeramia orbicularis]|uniref:protein lifeguard 3-like n=1 Tax=Sphaeramia orbicularis TaxID=375764 RepID=UPI00117EEB4F|nr:protein lifeguard 3-like [Sphaeramia orbicularis]